MRKKVEETFDCIFLEMMGNGDMCSEMWSECRYKKGMHFIAQGIVHPEIIDPDTGKVLEIKEGTRGELVYTSLDRECIPLVRFRTRDHVEVTQTSCECGRTGYGIRVFGRTDDMIIVQGVNVYPAAALTKDLAGGEMTEIGLLQQAGGVKHGDLRPALGIKIFVAKKDLHPGPDGSTNSYPEVTAFLL